jgi:hypothetical protein
VVVAVISIGNKGRMKKERNKRGETLLFLLLSMDIDISVLCG